MSEPSSTFDWNELRKPFLPEAVGQLPKPFSKDSPKGKCQDCGGWHGLPAMHLDYVGHAAVTDRLNTVAGPEGWDWEPLGRDEHGLPALDSKGNLWIRLTIHGVSRYGYGDGSDSPKELIGDALRNAAMRFGVALDLWSKEELESTLADPSLKNERATQRPAKASPRPAVGTKPAANEKPASDVQRRLIKQLLLKQGVQPDGMAIYMATTFDIPNTATMTMGQASEVITALEAAKS